MPKHFLYGLAVTCALVFGAPLVVAASREPAPATTAGMNADADAIRGQIQSLLAEQEQAWNRGDIPGFMRGYWQSPDLRFASGGSISKGYEPTLARYLSRYHSPELMGKLQFEIVEIDVLSAQAALVFGHWRLHRAGDKPQGLFTLSLKTIDGDWRIVSDHTSVAN